MTLSKLATKKSNLPHRLQALAPPEAILAGLYFLKLQWLAYGSAPSYKGRLTAGQN